MPQNVAWYCLNWTTATH